MKDYFYCTLFQPAVGTSVYSNGVLAMKKPNLDDLRQVVVGGLQKDGYDAKADQVVILAFNEVR